MQILQKKSATKRAISPYNGEKFVRTFGRHPELPRIVGEYRCFRKMQAEAFHKLVEARAWILNAGTGSGKSVVQKAIATACMRRGEKCIIAVPETSIARSFNTEFTATGSIQTYAVPDGSLMTWEVPPSNFLFEDSASITERSVTEQLLAFIEAEHVSTEGRIMVCTHAALVRAHQIMVAKWEAANKPRNRIPWRGVNLFIDEAHHAKSMMGEVAANEEVVESNELGKLIKHYIDYMPGRIGLTTATWLRGDAMAIVPEGCLDAFTRYEQPLDEYLDGLRHLKGISFKFSIGDFAETLQAEFERDRCKTIVYQPAIKPKEGDGKKLEYLAQYQETLKPFRLNIVDLVTPEGREDRRKAFEANQAWTDVVIVQNLFREGADWPNAQRSIVLGPRGSLPMVIQMLGRLLRDFSAAPNKDHKNHRCGVHCKREVEFHIVLPKTVLEDMTAFEDYAGVIFMVMALGWRFTVGLKLPTFLRSADAIREMAETLKDDAIRGGGASNSIPQTTESVVREHIEALAEKRGETLAEEEREEAVKTVTACLRGGFRIAAHAARDLLSPESRVALDKAIKQDPLKAAGALFNAQWGKERFQEFRESYVGLLEITPEYVDRTIILHRCFYFKAKGQYVDPRTIPGIVKYFGSKKALDEACRAEGFGAKAPHCPGSATTSGSRAATRNPAMTIRWPEHWDQEEGWPSEHAGSSLCREPRAWSTLGKRLRQLGKTLCARIVLLGGPQGRDYGRTVEDCDREIQAFFEKEGRRPSAETSQAFRQWQHWLYHHGSSLSRRCDELGLPSLRKQDRTVEDCDREIQAFFEKEGRRPSQGSSQAFRQWDMWLRYRGSSLSQRCDELGLPSLYKQDRTVEDCDREIQAFFEKEGRRPTGTNQEFANLAAWLRHHGSSLSRRCDALGLSKSLELNRTVEDCDREIQAFFEKEGRRPSAETSQAFRQWQQWLYHHGSSLSQRCDELGLPSLYKQDRTVEDCDREIQAFFDKEGRYPSVKTSLEFRQWDAWLRYRGSSISRRCAELRQPSGY